MTVVDAALRSAVFALIAWTLAAATWVVFDVSGAAAATTVDRMNAPSLSRSRAEPVARGGRALATTVQLGSDAVLRVAAATPPDALPETSAAAAAASPEPAPAPTIDTPQGRLEYVSSRQVLATYYTPANCGKLPGSRWYGITATGARATRGIVAVDPRVIPMYSWLYIPGYGVAQARDVGSAIIGDHIDVAFDDGDGAWWGRRTLTVYLLPGAVGR